MPTSKTPLVVAFMISSIVIFSGLLILFLYLNSNSTPGEGDKTTDNNANLDLSDQEVIQEQFLETSDRIVPSEDFLKLATQKTIKKSVDFHEGETELQAPNNDIYQITLDDPITRTTKISHNGNLIWEKKAIFTGYNNLRRMFLAGNDLIIGFDDWKMEEFVINDIYVNDQSLNQAKGYTHSFAPAPLNDDNGKFYFFAKKDLEYYLISGTQEIPLPYDLIIDPTCCEPESFSIKSGYEEVHFYARRDENWYFVMINVNKLFN